MRLHTESSTRPRRRSRKPSSANLAYLRAPTAGGVPSGRSLSSWRLVEPEGHLVDSRTGSSVVWPPHQLADLDQVAVRITHVTADFRSAVDWRRQKLRATRGPLRIHVGDVGNPDVHEAGDAVHIRRRLQ